MTHDFAFGRVVFGLAVLRQLNSYLATLAITAIFASKSMCGELNDPGPVIRIPAIVHKWRQAEDENTPEISIEEISTCIGVDYKLQGRIVEIQGVQAKLESEFAEIKRRSDLLTRSSLEIQSEREDFEKSLQAFNAATNSLDQRRSEIDHLRANSKVSVADAKKINSLIDSYNADVSANKKKREHFVSAQKLFETKVSAHNASVGDVNELATRFGERNSAFKLQADRFNEDIARYASRCSGSRVIKK